MSAPFIFIATNRLREGKLAAERDRAADLGSFIEATEPQILAFNEYVNDDGTEVHVHDLLSVLIGFWKSQRQSGKL